MGTCKACGSKMGEDGKCESCGGTEKAEQFRLVSEIV